MTMTQQGGSAWAIGVDVGGTKVAAGFVDAHGQIRQHTRVPMNSHGTAEEGLAAVTSAIDELLKLAPDKNAARRPIRSEERRVGKECRSRGVPAAYKKKREADESISVVTR